MKKTLFILSLMFVVIISGTLIASADDIVIKLAHEEPANIDNSSAHAAAVAFKNVIETQSNGEMTVKIYPGSSMGKQRERMELTKANIIQVNIASIGGIAQFYPEISAIDLPFAFPNHTVAYKVLDGEFGQLIQEKLLDKTDLRFLTTSAGGFYVLSNNVRPVRTPADMKGIKFRTMSVPSHIAMMKSLGAAATPVAWSELYTSLQTGVVQGQHNPIPIMAIGGLQEVQNYATLTNHLYGCDWWLTSQKFYESLSTDQQNIFNNAVSMAATVGRGHKQLLNATRFGVKFLEDAGVEVYAPSIAELKEFKELAVPAVMKTIEEDFGQEGLELANKLLDVVKELETELY